MSQDDTERRAYTKPRLVRYGSVAELTRGASGSGADGPLNKKLV